MTSVVLGLVAALAWGIHDLFVRLVTRSLPVPAALLVVLVFGTLACLPIALLRADWPQVTLPVAGLGLLAGAAYVLACLGLYRAFAEGPVKLVAPIIGAYPVLSVGWAQLSGSAVGVGDWLAVGLIVAGVGAVAALADPGETSRDRARAILYAVLSGTGFAVSFALAHRAAINGGEWSVIMLMRGAAVALVLGLVLAGRSDLRGTGRHIGTLAGMGLLDATALAFVTMAATLPNPEFAAVTTSVFGVVTILLARVFLRERVRPAQWCGIAAVFSGVALLGL